MFVGRPDPAVGSSHADVAKATRLARPRARLAQLLCPATTDERQLLEGLDQRDAVMLAVMVERAIRREFLAGAEIGRREVEEETR